MWHESIFEWFSSAFISGDIALVGDKDQTGIGQF